MFRLYDDTLCVFMQLDFFNQQLYDIFPKPLSQIARITDQIVDTVSTVYLCIAMPIFSALTVFIILAETDKFPIQFHQKVM